MQSSDTENKGINRKKNSKNLLFILSAVIVVGVVAILVLLVFSSPAQSHSTSSNGLSADSLASNGVSAEILIQNSSISSTLSMGFGTSGRGFNGSGHFVMNGSFPGGAGNGFHYNGTPSGGTLTDIGGFFASGGTLNQEITSEVSDLTGVYAASPELSSSMYIDGQSASVYGIVPSTYSEVFGPLNITSGSDLNASQGNYIILEQATAESLGVSVGSEVTVGNTSIGGTAYTVVGIYDLSEFGSSTISGLTQSFAPAYVQLSSLQTLLNEPGLVSEIGVKCTTPSDISCVASEINSTISGIMVTTNTTYRGSFAFNNTGNFNGNFTPP